MLAIGKNMPAWVVESCRDYSKRLPKSFAFAIHELAQSRESSAIVAVRQEGELLLSKLDRQEWVVALDVTGKPLSTEAFADQLQNWQMQGRDVSLLIGGPDGLSADVLSRADMRMSMSAMTLPHPLVRIVLVEQIYRAHTILTNHPYHRA